MAGPQRAKSEKTATPFHFVFNLLLYVYACTLACNLQCVYSYTCNL